MPEPNVKGYPIRTPAPRPSIRNDNPKTDAAKDTTNEHNETGSGK